MNAWYLHHSGFAVRTDRHFLIFDSFRDDPRGGKLRDGVIDPEELRELGLEVAVFASHRHGDHFSRKIFDWQKTLPEIRYILSDDIPGREPAERMCPGETRAVGELEVRTLASTDEGVAFLVKADGVRIYHAGDLNWWHWEGETDACNARMAADYRGQIDLLKGEPIDLAFVPVDPRLGGAYLYGVDYFMRAVGARRAVPMHLWDDFGLARRLIDDPRSAPYRDRVIAYTRRGEQLL